MSLKVRLDNDITILNAIRELSDIDKNKTIKYGLAKASRIFVDAGKSNIRTKGLIYTGNLLASIKNKVKKDKLGALAGGADKGYHLHLVDSGTKARYTRKGKYRGIMPASGFWRQAYDSNEDRAGDVLYDSIADAIERINNKMV